MCLQKTHSDHKCVTVSAWGTRTRLPVPIRDAGCRLLNRLAIIRRGEVGRALPIRLPLDFPRHHTRSRSFPTLFHHEVL
jgi:hypothetical protein